MKILALGPNYAPEPVGIGPFTAGLLQWLAARGHQVTMVCGKPYYPAWRVADGYRTRGYQRTREEGVEVVRCPLHVPAHPTGRQRILHHFSFAVAAAPMLATEARRLRPDLVMSVAPSLIAAPAARMIARRAQVPHWLHIQDFEVEAALATGLLGQGRGIDWAQRFERWALDADTVSTISPQMCARLRAKGLPSERVVEFRNWASVDPALAGDAAAFRTEWGIDRPHVALYAGSIAAKQGIGTVIDAARRLAHRRDLLFVLCGEGAERPALERAAAELDNVLVRDLQPAARLPDLLAMATMHLLPQIAGAADLVLPSKLANMLASGRPVVATAAPGTGLATEVAGCGRVARPDDPAALADAISGLLDDQASRTAMGQAARQRAGERWNKEAILSRVESQMVECVARGRSDRSVRRPVPA